MKFQFRNHATHSKISPDRRVLRALSRLRRLYRSGEPVNFDHFLNHVGAGSIALIAAVLALPMISPLPMGPFSMPASMLIVFLSWQLLHGRDIPRLPGRFLRAPFPQRVHGVLSWMLIRFSRVKRRFVRPRLANIVHGHRGRMICAVGMLVGGLLVLVPIPLVPFSNSFPAMGVFLFALGWLERDGGLTMLGAVANLIGFVIISTALAIGFIAGWETLQMFSPIG